MALSDWQLNRLRNALAAHHAYGDDTEGDEEEKKRPPNWKFVVEGLVEAAGGDALGLSDDPKILAPDARAKRVRLYAERLRQFVEGYTGPDGVRKYPEPQPALLDAIVKFATDENNGLLTADELKEFRPDWQAPHRLLEYLDHKLDAARILPPVWLEGAYQGERSTEKALVVSELTLQRASKEGLIQAVQVDEFYDPSLNTVRGMKRDARDKARTKPRKQYGGWAVLTPEDTLLLFMKDALYLRNHYYFTLASDLSRASEKPVERLTCLYHDYALETEDDALREANIPSPALVMMLESNIVFFNRIKPDADA